MVPDRRFSHRRLEVLNDGWVAVALPGPNDENERYKNYF